ncbi:cyclic nucleotide-binding domain-containing protein [Thermodesulfobacteriota bacterium]
MKELIQQAGLKKYFQDYAAGVPVFIEGDESQDLYILVSGRVTIFKAETPLAEISEPGSLFGEMSFLLRHRRTATVRAHSQVTAVRIPSGRINEFLDEFPSVASKLSIELAERLYETTTILHGLREFCDLLPDAVVLTNDQFRVLAWNKAAENLYGRSWEEMQNALLHDIYEDQAAYRQFLDQLSRNQTIQEKPLKIRHPELHWRFVATSTNIINDGHNTPKGYLFVGRDVTAEYSLKKKALRLTSWLAPLAFVLGFLTATILCRSL